MDFGAELLLFAGPEMGHLLPLVDLGRLLVALDARLSVAIFIPKFPVPNADLDASIRSLAGNLRLDPAAGRIELVELPPLENLPPDWAAGGHVSIVDLITRLYKPVVKRLAATRGRTAGIVFDMFCAHMVDVAEELGVPAFLFYTSGLDMLTMTFALEALGEPDLHSKFADAPPESTPVNVPGFRTPVPRKVWPFVFTDEKLSPLMMRFASQYRRAKGILVNSFAALDSVFIAVLSEDKNIPPVYAVGPILQAGSRLPPSDPTMSWLDEQPEGSVVFLCFGSKVGSFEKPQVEQIATGLERSGYRFLWSLRAPSLKEILPEGFIERTAGAGKVIGWAPQKEVLAHKAVGAFVSHCGWNSVLESLWFGVPVVAWPTYAEQQLNAFLLVRERGLAVDLRMDFQFDVEKRIARMLVPAPDVEAALRRVMDQDEGAAIRDKMLVVSAEARAAIGPGGSSYVALSRFVDGVFENLG